MRSNLVAFCKHSLHDIGIVVDVAVVLAIQEESRLETRGFEQIKNMSTIVSSNLMSGHLDITNPV
jgi:hypothetical protein